MKERLEPLDPALAALFAEEQASYAEHPDLRNRVRRRIEVAVALGSLSAGAAIAQALPGTSDAPQGQRPEGARAPESPAATAGAALSAKKALLLTTIAFGVGVGAGEMHSRATAVTPAPVASVSTARETPSAATTALAVFSPEAGIQVEELPLVKAAISGDAATTAANVAVSNLAAEQLLIDTARAGLSRGRAADALATADEHARKYPGGHLAEERETLAIQALVLLGRGAEARARGVRFHRSYPTSLYGGSVDAVLSKLAPTDAGGVP